MGPIPVDDVVRAAADRLPFALLEPLWLVDVCCCSYEVAAANLGVTSPDIAGRVHTARRLIASNLGHQPRRHP